MLNEKELKLLKEIGLNFDYTKKLSAEQVIQVENVVGDYLTLNYIDDEYKPTEEGKVCYSILDKIDEL